MENLDINSYKHIHMIGIGGISMSAIAEFLLNFGFTVTGSDATNSEIIDKLKSKGIPVCIGHDMKNSSIANLVVHTAAISKDDPEIVNAKKYNIPIVERADFLGALTKKYKETICISGTHGKTTTTSMISLCFLEASLDPSIQVGAILKDIDGNYKVGNSDYLILEACEFVESFLKFHPKSEVILNIDNDHLDYFKTFDNIKNAFIKYAKLLPEDGTIVLNADDPNCLDLINFSKAKAITYGLKNQSANFYAKNLVFDNNGFYQFDVFKNSEFYDRIKLSVRGIHNVSNALACIALCDLYNISKEHIKNALFKFTGANRRFEYVGSFNDVSIFDDYAHHPTEIESTLNSAKNINYNESWIVFQPHTYSRTKNLLEDFTRVLAKFDNVIITDVYAARENNIYGITAKDLADKIKLLNNNTKYISDFNDISNFLKGNAKPNDIILTVGAGTITELGRIILDNEQQKKHD